MKNDKIDQATRLAKRDAILNAMFNEMRQDDLPFMDCYQLLGDFIGLGDSQIRRIIKHHKSLLVLSTTELSYFSVLLQRISEKLTKRTDSL